MEKSEIIDRVAELIGDPSMEDYIEDFLYDTMCDVVETTQPGNMKVKGTHTTSVVVPYVTLPVDYIGPLTFVCSVTQGYVVIKRYDDLEQLYMNFPGIYTVGSIAGVTAEGNVLWQSHLATETLDIIYFKAPTQLTLDTDIPSWCPSQLHYPLFVNGVAAKIYEIIEDGIEAPPVNHNKHYEKFNLGLMKYHEYLAKRRTLRPRLEWQV